MAITKTIVANSNTRSVVKITAAADGDTTTIALAELVHSAYAQSAVAPKVNITKAWYSVSSGGAVTVVRNGVTILKLFGHDTIEGFGFAEQNDQSLVVTFTGTTGGTIILELVKLTGFSASYADPT